MSLTAGRTSPRRQHHLPASLGAAVHGDVLVTITGGSVITIASGAPAAR
ncbi:MAG: hypothetical protein IPN05_19815 [Sulfuritalea sp.]|nr:hypothetical protein [Sulfuritalea sp.]